MALLRDTKARAKRIDLTYFKKPNAFRKWTRILSLLLPAAGLGWVVAMAARGDERLYNSGMISTRHAMLENKCEACHTTPWAMRYTKPEEWQERLDQACLTCHDAPGHHRNAVSMLRTTKDGHQTAARCSQCHLEHKGASRLASVNDRTCTQCHADLKTTGPEPHPKSCPIGAAHAIHPKIDSFESGHPEFALIAKKSKDPTVLNFNHAVHLDPDTSLKKDLMQKQLAGLVGRRGVQKDKVLQLGCSYCHQTVPAGDSMMPVYYETHCRDCHPIKSEGEKIPHVAADALRDFFRSRIAKKGATGDALGEKVAEAEIPVYTSDPDGCMKCHKTDLGADFPNAPPVVTRTGARTGAPGQEGMPRRWFEHSFFNHETHRELRCSECHVGVGASKLTSDLLMPNQAVCLKCHSTSGAVSSACVTCHRFHDRAALRPGEGRLQIFDVVK